MLLNLSNHPISSWDSSQLLTAQEIYGTVTDLDFPKVRPEADEEEIDRLALKYFDVVSAHFDQCANDNCHNAVHIQGEFTFCFRLVNLLKSSGIECIASTTEREVRENGNQKTSTFKFIRFRKY